VCAIGGARERCLSVHGAGGNTVNRRYLARATKGGGRSEVEKYTDWAGQPTEDIKMVTLTQPKTVIVLPREKEVEMSDGGKK